MFLLKITRWPSVLVFVLAGCAAIILAFVTANLFSYAMANVQFVRDFGFEAVKNGALVQILELVLWGGLAMICWFIFKVCEHILTDRYIAWSNKHDHLHYSSQSKMTAKIARRKK